LGGIPPNLFLKKMIIKKDNKYYLKGIEKEGNAIAWELNSEEVEIRKKKEHCFLYITRWLGLVGVNILLLNFLKFEGKKKLNIIMLRGLKKGKIIVDVDELLLTGEPFHNKKPPFDNQLVITRKIFNECSDDVAKEIMKEIWEEYKPELEQRQGIFNKEKKINGQQKLF